MWEIPIYVVVIGCIVIAYLALFLLKANNELKQKDKDFNFRQEQWRQNEIEKERVKIEFSMRSHFEGQLEKWKIECENDFRQDAIRRSRSVIIGQVTEHVVPFFSEFPYNPKEVRFIGSPIDLIVFKNLEDENEQLEVHFVEIKTSNSSLSRKQRRIFEAIEAKRVHWRKVNYLPNTQTART